MRPYWKGYLKLALVSCPIAFACGVLNGRARPGGGAVVCGHRAESK
jgi:hypothetical protein